MPRPTKISDDVQQRVVDALRLGATHEHAALVAGISERSFHRWMHEGENASRGQFWQFWQAVKKAEAEAAVGWLDRIERAAIDSWQAAAWKLERRFPDQWGRRERQDVNLSGSVDVRRLIRNTQAALDAVLPHDPEIRERFAEKLAEFGDASEAMG